MPNELAKATEKTPEIFDSRSVVKKLEHLMDKVTEKEASPDTVNAACNCAGRIVDILKLHLELERLKGRRAP